MPGTAAEAADPPLAPAQIALFEAPHLAGIALATRLDYEFRREEAGRDTVADRITLDVTAAKPDGGRDVHVAFLTGERTLRYPPALGFRSNPLPIFALDRDTREVAAATGGSVAWFRTRLRRAFEQATIQDRGDGRVEIAIAPYRNEPRAARYQERTYSFVLQDSLPGGIAEIRTTLPAADGRAAVLETIVFAGSRAE